MDAFPPSSLAPPSATLPFPARDVDKLFVTALTVSNILVVGYDLCLLGLGLR